MGLREKVTITLVIIALIQIACRHCMPSASRKASLNRCLNDLRPVKNNPVPTPYSPTRVNKTPKQTFGRRAQNGRISQNTTPKKSLYKTYNFPENEYPLDNSPRDPFRLGMNLNDNNQVRNLQKTRNLQSSAINDLKKEMKMKRKLLSNQKIYTENSQLKTDMTSMKCAPNFDSMHLLHSETFPEVQYPLNTMETWGPNYWRSLQFPQEKQCNRFEQQTFNLKVKEDINKPFTRLTKAKASKFLQSYDKLKEEQRRTSTENSKRSNIGQKGLNFTKTATCERVSDDFITEGLVSKVPSKPSVTKTLEPTTDIETSLENTCPITDYSYHAMPIPYKVIENNTEDICPTFELKNNTKRLHDLDTNVIAQTLQLIEEILLHDDATTAAPPSNSSKEIEIEKEVDSSVSEVQPNEDVPITLIDTTKNCTIPSTKYMSQEVPDEAPAESSQEASDDAPAGHLQGKILSLPEEILTENTTAEPLNVRMPLPFSQPMTNEEHAIVTSPGQTNVTPLINSDTVPGTTSIIIIPINNNDFGKSQSHMFETTSGSPIILYLPSTQTSGTPTQTQNQIVSSSLDNSVPNNQLHNVFSNMAPLQSDNPSSTTRVSELLNSISDCGSFLPIFETLPTNSMCYNNESSLSSMEEKPISEISKKSLGDDALLVTEICEDKLYQQPTNTGNFDMNADTLPQTPDFKHPLFDFADSEFSSLSHEPYSNVLDNELPILVREINSDQQISNFESKDLFFPIQNVMSEYLLHTNISEDTLPEIINDASAMSLDKNFSFETPTDYLAQPIDEMPTAPLVETTVEQPQSKEASLNPTPLHKTLSEKLPEITDMKLPPTLSTTTDAPQLLDNTPSTSPILNSSPMTTDVTIKNELYKIRQLLDKMLSFRTAPISDTNNLPLLENQSLLPVQTQTEGVPLPEAGQTSPFVPATDLSIDSLPLKEYETFLPFPVDDRTLTGTLSLPEDKLHVPNVLLETKSPRQPIDETVPSTLVLENPTGNKSDIIDNLVIPLSESRIKDTSKNYLLSKMDLVIPHIYEISTEDPLLTIGDLPVIVYQERTKTPKSEVSMNDLPIQIFDKVLSCETPTDVQTVPMHTILSLASDTDSLPQLENQSLLPAYRRTDSAPLHAVDKTLLPLTETNLPINSLPLKEYETFSHLPVDGTLTDYISLPVQKLLLKNVLLETDSLRQPIEETDSPTPKFKNSGSNKPDIIDNLVIPLSETLTKDTPKKDLFRTTNDVTSKMDLVISKNPEVSNGDMPLTVRELPILVHQEYTKNPKSEVSTNHLPMQEVELQYPLSDVPVSDLPMIVHREHTLYPKSEVSTNHLPKEVVESQNLLSYALVNNLPMLHQEPTKNRKSELSTNNLPVQVIETQNALSDVPVSGLRITVHQEHMLSQKSKVPKNDLPMEMVELQNPLSDVPVIDLPLKKDREHTQNLKSEVSTNPLPIQMVETQNPLSDISVSDELNPTEALSMPEVLGGVLPDVSSESHTAKITNYSDKVQRYFPPSTVHLSEQNHKVNFALSTAPNLSLLDANLSETIGDLPIMVHQEHTSKPKSEILTNHLPMQMVEPQNPHHEVPVSDLLNSTTALSIPEVLEAVLPEVSSEKPTSIISDHTGTVQKNLPPFIVHSSKDEHKHKVHFTVSIAPVVSLFDAFTNEPLLADEAPSSENYEIAELLHALTDTKDVPLVMEQFLSPQDDKSPNASVIDIPSSVSWSINNGVKLTNLDKNIDEVLSESTLSDITRDDLPLPDVKMLPLIDKNPTDLTLPIKKISPTSKLQKTKIILENVLSDITKGSLSSAVAKPLPVTPPSVLDKTHNYVSEEYPRSEAKEKEIPPADKKVPTDLPFKMNEIYKEKTDILTDDVETPERTETLPLDYPANDVLLPTDKVPLPIDTLGRTSLTNKNTPSGSKLKITKVLLENVLSDVTSKGFSVPVSKAIPVKSSAVLDKTPYNLEAPVSEITKHSLLEDESLPDAELSDHAANNNLPFSAKFEDTLPVEVDKTLSEVSSLNTLSEMSLDGPMDMILPDSNNDISWSMADTLPLPKGTPKDLPIPNTKIASFSKLTLAKALLENVLSDINTKGFSMPESKSLPFESHTKLDKILYYIESPDSDINEESPSLAVDATPPNTALFDPPTDNNFPFSKQSQDTLPLELDKTLSDVSSFDFLSVKSSDGPMDKIPPDFFDNILSSMAETVPLPKDTPSNLPLSNTKTSSSSKLKITKALLENVLSDIKTMGFSLQVAKSLPIESRSQLDKTLYYIESPLSDINEETPTLTGDKILPSALLSDYPTDSSLPFSEQSGDALLLELEKKLSDVSSLETPTEISSLMDKVLPNSKDDISSPMAETLPFSKDTINDLPSPNTTPSSSKLTIFKALLENVLSDINTKGLSLPEAKSLPGESNSKFDKILYYIESPLSEIKEETPTLTGDIILPNAVLSDHPTDSSLPFSEQSGNAFLLELEKKLSEGSRLETPTEIESLMDKVLPNSKDDISSPMDETLSFSKDTLNDLPSPNTKTRSSSKLKIAKVVLENVYTDINTKGFSLPVATFLPVESRSQLDKSLMDPQLSDLNEEHPLPDILNDNFPPSEINEGVTELPIEDFYADDPDFDMDIDELPIDQMSEDRSDNLTEEVDYEDSYETYSEDPIDYRDNLSIEKDEQHSLSDNISEEISSPQSKPLFPSTSRISIAKTLLEQIYSDIADGGIRP